DLAARRADRLPRPRRPGHAHRRRRRACRRGRPGGGGDACAARLRQVARAASRRRGPAGMSAFRELVCRDLRLAWKEGGTVGVALGFYLVVVTLLPLGIGPDLNLLTRIAPGVLWVALLLSALL